MHNLWTVISFEFLRTIKKRTFWLSVLVFPAILIFVFAVSYFSNKVTTAAQNKTNQEKFSFVVQDNSGLISPSILQATHSQLITNKDAGIQMVQNGQIDAFFYYPSNPTKQPVEVFGKDISLTKNSKYTATATTLLTTSVEDNIKSPETLSIIQKGVQTDLTTYTNGSKAPGIEGVIAPGAILVLFYLVVILLGNQMLSSTTEEKENRVSEMILTSVNSRSLIIGKIISLAMLGAVQVSVTVIPILIALRFFSTQLNLPSIDLTHIVIAPLQLAIGIIIFICGFFLFTGILVAIGAALPTAKEASNFFGIAVFSMFVPIYGAAAIVTSPDQIIVKFFSFFPLTAPITLLLRNAVGNLTNLEAITGILILVISSVLILTIAIRAFRYGTLEYSRKLSFKEIIGM